jgi:hypothetical protein
MLALFVAAFSARDALHLETVERGIGAGQPIAITIAAVCATVFFALRFYRGIRKSGWIVGA